VIVLDTNVLSALMQRRPDADVARWLDAQPQTSLWTTSVTAYEIRSGIEVMPASRRRRQLEDAYANALEIILDHRVLPFDLAAATAAGAIAAKQRRGGRPVEVRDVQIAGIVVARKASLATRNVRHFAGIGVNLVDPWSGN
jgi:predicted nucleic acid-binding protein